VSPSKRPSQSCHNFVVEECPVWCVNTGKFCNDRCQQYHNVGVSNGGDVERILDDQTLDQCEAACISESFGCQEYEYDTVGGKCKLFSFYSLVFDESDTTKITGLCSRTSAPTELPTTSMPPGLKIVLKGEGVLLSGEIEDGEQFNDSCFFANDGECDVGGPVPLCNEGTDCGDCGNCDEIFTRSSESTESNPFHLRKEIYIAIILVCVVGFGLAIYFWSKQQTEVAKSDLEIGQKQLPTANSPSISLNRKISLQKIVDFSFSSNDCTGGALFGEGEESHVQISE